MNVTEFYKYINQLPDKFDNRDMEEYLLALYKLIENNKTEELTYNLILNLISKAFTSEPVEFNNEWLDYISPPDEDRMRKNFTNPQICKQNNQSNISELLPYDYTIEVLKFQIAELHKMKGKQLENEWRYMGIKSETGNYWYNFDPFANLECGTIGMKECDTDFSSLDWSFFGELLEYGRVFE